MKNGRYGPYVSHDGVNATLPSDKTPETITLDEALVLIAARAAQGGEGRDARRGKTAKPAGGAAAKKKAVKAKSGGNDDTDAAVAAAKAKKPTAKSTAPTSAKKLARCRRGAEDGCRKTHQGGKVRRLPEPRYRDYLKGRLSIPEPH